MSETNENASKNASLRTKSTPVFCDADANKPGFDLAMELLCSLPRRPKAVHFTTLARELQIPTQAEAMGLVDQLRLRGFEIYVTNADSYGRVVCVGENTWPAAREAADEYWERVYG